MLNPILFLLSTISVRKFTIENNRIYYVILMHLFISASCYFAFPGTHLTTICQKPHVTYIFVGVLPGLTLFFETAAKSPFKS
uniref:Uncharacterized protein n=1 Tax=Aegilops tauschii subsp. strangulata TaxID=200361 RepID=A0A453MA93_AEGTS